MRFRYTPHMVALSLALVVAFLPSAARADRALHPLGELVERAELIVIGTLYEVRPGKSPGQQVGRLQVEQVISGSAGERIAIAGSSNDPGLPELFQGTRVIAFLAGSNNDVYSSVEGEHGVMVVAEGAVEATRALVSGTMNRAAPMPLARAMPMFRQNRPQPPRVLMASFFEEASVRASQEDAAQIRELACDRGASYSPAARQWAISQVGARGMRDARECLEAIVSESRDPRIRTSAIEALGELGDPASSAVLERLTPEPALEPGETNQRIDDDDQGEHEDRGAAAYQADEDGETKADRKLDPEKIESAPRDDGESAAVMGEGVPLGDPSPEDDSVVDEEPDEVPTARRFSAAETEAALLALGKIGAPGAVPMLLRYARFGGDPALASTAVHALGLVASDEAKAALAEMGDSHADELIRAQAKSVMQRLQKTTGKQ